MKISILPLLVILLLWGCSQPKEKKDSKTTDTYLVENIPAKVDDIIIDSNTTQIPDSSMPEPHLAPPFSIEGKHALTLQWISWDRPGSVMIKKGEDEWYDINGKQEAKGEYLRINGKIRVITELQLEFDGVIETLGPDSIYCKREGLQTFLSTKNRQYWRLQNMLNCDGVITDYVDIYF